MAGTFSTPRSPGPNGTSPDSFSCSSSCSGSCRRAGSCGRLSCSFCPAVSLAIPPYLMRTVPCPGRGSGYSWPVSYFSCSPSRRHQAKRGSMADYQLRPLSIGEILDGALVMLRRHFTLVLGIAVVCEGIPTAMDVYIDLTGGGSQNPGLSLLDRSRARLPRVAATGSDGSS